MLIKHIKDKLDIVQDLPRDEFVTRSYAKEIFERLMDTRNLIVFDEVCTLADVTENILLLGLWDWEMYSDAGNSLCQTDDITMRLFGKKGLTQNEIDILTGGKDLFVMQAEALKTAASFILSILKEIGHGTAAAI